MEKAENDAGAAVKVKRYQVRPREELYDLANDPWERIIWPNRPPPLKF